MANLYTVLSACVFVTVLNLNTAVAAETARSCAFEGFTAEGCERVQSVVSRWKVPALAGVVVAGVPDATPVASERPDLPLDQANAKAAATEVGIGPCRYNETEGRVEVQAQALKLSDEGLTQCLAAAYAHARYRSIEARWLEHLGEHEAWVVQGGLLRKVSVDRKLQRPAAQQLWSSFATRELVRAAPAAPATAGRAIASSIEAPEPAGDGAVRELLGLD